MRHSVIFDIDELELIDFNEVLETSADTIRKSIDETKAFVKWDGEMPQCVQALQTKQGPYTISELLEILAGEDWRPTINF